MDHIASRSKAMQSLDGALTAEQQAVRDQTMAVDARLETATKELEELHRAERAFGATPNPADPAFAACREKIKATEQALLILRREREALEKAMHAARSTSSPELDRVRGEYEAACRDFAHFVVDDQTNFGPEFDEARGKLIALHAAFDRADKELALRVAAVVSYDATAVAKAKMVIGGAIAALAVVVIVVALAVFV
jgi:hypothetical protein